MSNGSLVPRDIRESEQVSKAKDRAAREFSRFEDGWLALTWHLARAPEELGVAYLKGYRLHKFAGVAGENPIPAIMIIFGIKDDVVEIIKMQIYEPEDVDYDFL